MDWGTTMAFQGRIKSLPIRRFLVRHWFYGRDALRLNVRVRDPETGDRYRFLADSLETYLRAKTFFTKEKGTIAWLRTTLRPDDAFLDIGANMGLYSIFAARQLSSEGHVYACEPHLPTTAKLIENAARNGVADRLSVISAAIAPAEGFTLFHYKRWRSGSSGSQLFVPGAPVLERPVGTELKLGISVDALISRGVIRRPDLIKIDTDGIELQILEGMRGLLTGQQRPRSVQVEMQPVQRDGMVALMRDCGYELAFRHCGVGAQAKVNRGRTIDEVISNAVFAPVEPAERAFHSAVRVPEKPARRLASLAAR
jgi:FkbM family methyltransferase